MDATNPSEVQSFSGGLDDAKLRALVTENPGNFDAWTSLIKEIEKASPNDIERIFSVYDAFLSEFPLCYGYWKKYADHRARLSTIDKVVEIYERAVQSAMYSVGLWVNYCGFGMLAFEDPVDIRRLFERALSFVGKDYLCHLLWDKYIEFEYSQKQWSRLAHIYLRTLRFPTKKLHIYHKSFKGLVSICEEEMKYQDSDATEVFSQVLSNCENTEVKAYKDQEISSVIEDLLTPPVGLPSPYTLKKYLSAGEYFYQKASDLDSKIKCFENRIRRPYFHMKLLDDVQLENWHRYLDFVEMQGDFDWTIKLYERCLIPCANYPEFWIRYVEFVETKGGREIANLALARATEIYLKRVPGIHLFCARFKEQTGDIIGARGAFRQCGFDLELHFVENVTRKANMEKRLGNVEAALIIYEKALDMAKEKQDSHTLGILYAQFSQFKYMVTASIDAARDILIKGIQHLPHCKLLLERLIQFEMMHGGPRKVDVLDSIIAQATAPPGTNVLQGMSTIEREDISKLFLEFVDLCGSIHDIRKACDRHRKLFPYQMRPTSSFQDMTSRNGSLDNAKTGGNDYPATLFHHGSGDISTQCSNHHSIPNNTSLQKTTDTRFDLAVIDQSKLEETNDGIKERLQQIETAMAVQETPTLDTAEQHIGVHDSVHEGSIGAQALEENAEVTKQVQIRADHEPQDDLIPPSLETLSINPQEDEIHQPTPTISLDCKALEATSVPNGNRTQDGGDTSEILISKSMVVQSDMPPQGNCLQENDNLQMESDSNSQTQIQTQAQADSQQMEHSVDGENWRQMNNPGEGQMDPTSHGNRPQDGGDTSEILISNSMVVQSDMPPQGNHRQENDNLHMESDSNSQTHIQTQAQPNSQKMVHSSVDGGNWHQMNYTGQGQMDPASHGYPQAQQLQHWQASQQPQYPTAGMQSHTITGQCYPCQPQPWENTQVQQANLAPNQYQVATGQVYPTGTHGWPAQNVQLQTFASVPQSQQSAQPVSHPQAQVYQYPYQSSQQFSHMQSNQGYTPQMWGYYQQHQHQLQQHQQQQIQPQQQQPPQQQLHPQQQQLQLQQYHQQLQQQQIQPQQQLPLQQQPPQQQLHPPQQQLQQQQYHQQQQQQIQMWNYNYYAQTLPVQYYESSQYGQEYGQQAIGSQGQVADQPNGEVSEHVDPHPQQQVPSSQ